MKRDLEEQFFDEEEENVVYVLKNGQLVPLEVEDDTDGEEDA